MYSTCLFCSANLGSNEVLESFPIGRRIAFDAARGRLWVVCRTCERWNLSPLEERWEVIETCERLFTDTRLRTSTENIGLARLRAGLDLIRIGEPLRPEFAAWRYGDQFGRRRRRAIMKAGAGLGAVGLVAAGAFGAGVGLVGMWFGGQGVVRRILHGNPNAIVTTLYDNDDRLVRLRRRHLEHVRLLGGEDGGFQLMVREGRSKHVRDQRTPIILHGEQARRAAGPVFAAINRFGGSKRTIEHAVTLLEHHPDPAQYVSFLASTRAHDATPVKSLDETTRLALEMAVHEDIERRALEGELAELERAWREAEEIAGIADQLLLPENIEDRMGRLKE